MMIIFLAAYSCKGPVSKESETLNLTKEFPIDSINPVSLPTPMPEPVEIKDTVVEIKYRDTVSDEIRKSMEISPLDTISAVPHLKKNIHKIKKQQMELDSLLKHKKRK